LQHPVDRHSLIERTAGNGAYGRIHAGGVATARQDCDVLHATEIITGCPLPGKEHAVRHAQAEPRQPTFSPPSKLVRKSAGGSQGRKSLRKIGAIMQGCGKLFVLSGGKSAAEFTSSAAPWFGGLPRFVRPASKTYWSCR